MRAKKHLGQHFLASRAVVKAIIEAGEVQPKEEILEIGPGRGILTDSLLQQGAFVTAIEKDPDLMVDLETSFYEYEISGFLKLLSGDALTFDPSTHFSGKNYKVIANIPYYITGELFRKFLEAPHQPSRIVFLVQKEVAERVVAKDGKESLLSLSVKVYGTPKIIKIVKAGSFVPPPKVDSAVLLISDISKDSFKNGSEKEFFTLLHAGFAHKRKMLLSNLVQKGIAERKTLESIFEQLSIAPKIRPEDLSLEKWLAVSVELRNVDHLSTLERKPRS